MNSCCFLKMEAGAGECGGYAWKLGGYASIWRLQFLNAIFFRYCVCKYVVVTVLVVLLFFFVFIIYWSIVLWYTAFVCWFLYVHDCNFANLVVDLHHSIPGSEIVWFACFRRPDRSIKLPCSGSTCVDSRWKRALKPLWTVLRNVVLWDLVSAQLNLCRLIWKCRVFSCMSRTHSAESHTFCLISRIIYKSISMNLDFFRMQVLPRMRYAVCSPCLEYIYIYIYTWNLFVLYFGAWTLQKKAFSNQTRGHLGSRYIHIPIYYPLQNHMLSQFYPSR